MIYGQLGLAICFTSFSALIYLMIIEYKQDIPIFVLIKNRICILFVQVIGTFAYMFSLYHSYDSVSLVLYSLTFFLIIFTMYKENNRFSNWISINVLISPIVSTTWLQIDRTPFEVPFGGIEQFFTPIYIIIQHLIFQFIIWLIIKYIKSLRIANDK